MCGIFGFAGSRLDPDHLARAAHGATRRGPHGHGWAAVGPTPGFRHQLGSADIDVHAIPPDATAVLGHGRLATSGPADAAGLQPLAAGPGWLAHNGNVYNAAQLRPAAVTDSHALALVYAHGRAGGLDPATALKQLVDQAEQVAWVIVVLDADGHLYGHRYTHPLFTCTTATGTYWSSRRCCATAEPLPELVPFSTAGER